MDQWVIVIIIQMWKRTLRNVYRDVCSHAKKFKEPSQMSKNEK